MDLLQTWVTSGRAMDLALAVVVLETVLLVVWNRRQRGHARAFEVMLLVMPGVLLMLALRDAVTGAPVERVALWMALSLPLHVMDVRQRFFRGA